MARGLAWGDVRLVEFGGPDTARPALVITRTAAIGFLNAVTVVPITQTTRDLPTEIPLGTAEGLKGPSVANADGIRAVAKQRVGRYLGSLSQSRRGEVREAVTFAFGLEET